MARQIRIRKTRRTRFTALLGAVMVLGLVALMSTPALAHHKADHEQGPDKAPNNVADDGDNAHPSGKDRSVENGKSGTQGKSESNPDDSKGPMRYEGALGEDKPNGPGGTDLADQDGNNGCGNDDDFDDDNNGWCGKPKAAPSPAPSVAPTPSVPDEVLGRTDKAEPKDEPKDEVLGNVLNNAAPQLDTNKVQGAVLPFTGGAIAGYLFAALGLLAAGIVAVRSK
jgi:hypothetical protein